MATATVLVPTHDHGRLLGDAVRSALAQTVSDLEVFIVGDGVDEATRATAAALAALDPRVRFFDRPKGDRHGEAHRHDALEAARGEIVCYLSDDDLWLPQHVECLARALETADFAHALPVYVKPSQEIFVHVGHLSAPASRARMQTTFNFIPLSTAAHTLALYRRLPRGWHPAPPNLGTDLHMWRQILAVAGCRAVSTMRATVLTFPSTLRRGWSVEHRTEELSAWISRLRDPALERELSTAALDCAIWSHVGVEEGSHAAAAECRAASERADRRAAECQAAVTLADERAAELDAARARAEERAAQAAAVLTLANRRATELDAEGVDLRQRLATLAADLAAAAEDAAQRRRVLTAMERTITWRMRNRLLAWRPVAAVARLRSRLESGS